MEVKFDLVRIGKIRQNPFAETILRQNLDALRESIRFSLSDVVINNKSNSIHIVMVIPAKGYNIKIALKDIQDKGIKKELQHNFPGSIYKGKYSIILDNMHNRIF